MDLSVTPAVTPGIPHPTVSPSDWVQRWTADLPVGATVLDVACGSGRHVRYLSERGLIVTGVDRDAQAVEALKDQATIVVADIENGPWPLAGQTFDAVIVTNYLWRALMPTLRNALKPGGRLIYETFALGHERFGRPSRPEFLLQAGELLRTFSDLQVVAFEEGLKQEPDRRIQRLCAVDGNAAIQL
jgi:SAM-dependent methyltransferase